MQRGDVEATYADTKALLRDAGVGPRTPMAVGLIRWAACYRDSGKSEGA